MISITVNDPTAADAKVLRAIADVLDGTGGMAARAQHWENVKGDIDATIRAAVIEAGSVTANEIEREESIVDGRRIVTQVSNSPANRRVVGDDLGPAVTIAPADNPAAGAVLTSKIIETQPGSPNFDGAEAFEAHLNALPVPAAVLFAAGAPPLPNVQGPTPTPPPLPLPSSQTSMPPSTDATPGLPATPPPPAPAPAPVSGAAPTTPAVLIDSAGMLWDGRIHASTKATISDGTWKKRRGVDTAVVAEVEAQLRIAAAIPAPAPAAGWPFPTDNSAVTAPTFGSMMQYITERIQNKALTQEQVTAAVQSVGLQSVNLVMSRADLIPAIMDALRAIAP